MVYNFLKPGGQDLASVMVLIDEAAEVINDQVIKMLNKTRGAWVPLIYFVAIDFRLRSPSRFRSQNEAGYNQYEPLYGATHTRS